MYFAAVIVTCLWFESMQADVSSSSTQKKFPETYGYSTSAAKTTSVTIRSDEFNTENNQREVTTANRNDESPSPHKSKNYAKNNLPTNFFQNLNPVNLIRPISDKISSISASLSLPHQPNNGFSYLLNPHYLWKQITDKGQQLLSNPSAAIFGVGQIGGHDYPFPYRVYNAPGLFSNNSNLRKLRSVVNRKEAL